MRLTQNEAASSNDHSQHIPTLPELLWPLLSKVQLLSDLTTAGVQVLWPSLAP